jgi:S-adenosylmethionine hydrolase
MSRPIIALLTDFGLRDHYAGTMKGVALGICPDATLVDISHEVPAHDVLTGALELAASYRYFPPRTVFLVVVDPGVGSSRRGIAAEAGEYRFVAPDNGVLTIAFAGSPPGRVVELTDPRYARPDVSRTFEGRDRFAPAAAWLALGIELTALGRPSGPLQQLDIPRPSVTPDGIDGVVLRVDRFGNLITNIDRKTLEAMGSLGALTIAMGSRHVPGIVSTYAEAPPGELCALFGSSDWLEIAANGASAATEISAGRGAAVHVGRRA